MHSTDFATRQSAPRLGGKMTGKDKNIRTKTIVNEVVGEIEAKDVQKLLEKECGAESTVMDASCRCSLVYEWSIDEGHD